MMNRTKQDTKKFRGFIHIHTTYSYDGILSLSDIANLVKNRHDDFILLTEHAEGFDDNKMHAFVNECAKASDGSFLVIPGLEFNINNTIHILGIGIEKYINETNPEKLIQKIHENNGLAILAHTVVYKNISYSLVKDIDFIEIWNPRYGETIAPSLKSIKILHEFRKMKKTYIALGGLDLHILEDLLSLYLVVFSSQLTQKDILKSMKQGEFTTAKGFIELPPLKDPAVTMTGLICLFAFVQFISNICKKIIRKIYKKSSSRL